MTIAGPSNATDTAEQAATAAQRRGRAQFEWFHELADAGVPGGARDHLTIAAILELLSERPDWAGMDPHQRREYAGFTNVLLEWLAAAPGDGWQARWLGAGCDESLDWVDALISPDNPFDFAPKAQRDRLVFGISSLILLRVIFPSYKFLTNYNPNMLFTRYRTMHRPELFAEAETRAAALSRSDAHRRDALRAITKVAVRTGKDLDQLTAMDLLTFRAGHTRTPAHRSATPPGLSLGWAVLRGIADLGEHATLREAARKGQLTSTEIIDFYKVRSPEAREVFIRYLEERRPHLDYRTLTGIVTRLVGAFWCDIEAHHPDQTSLNLPADMAEAWRQRLRTAPTRTGSARTANDCFHILGTVRAFYRDLNEWAVQDPTWAAWSFPSPVRKKDIVGKSKARKQHTAAMHQRIRERLPHLPTLVASAEQHCTEQAALLAATKKTPLDGIFEHSGRRYRRIKAAILDIPHFRLDNPLDRIEDLETGEIIDIERTEHDAFWIWAVIEVLRLTGVRIEELLEITHLGLVTYTLPKTSEIVPMLQIVPSKSNEERLLLVSPELASVLAVIVSRLRSQNSGTIPLTARYDTYERVTGPELPHLFQYRKGWSWQCFGTTNVHRLMSDALARAGITDAAGGPLRYTPHDFRRLWATDAVSNGLPVHIAAKILGHKQLSTTQVYAAVFDEHLIRAYRSFLDSRRALRPEGEYREPTEQEWEDFQGHFEKRKLELGSCARPYGSRCSHEFACVRCPSLRVDGRSRDRLVEIIANLRDRITEARINGWTGEVDGLTVSLNAAAAKLTSLDRIQQRSTRSTTPTPTDLGFPAVKAGPAC